MTVKEDHLLLSNQKEKGGVRKQVRCLPFSATGVLLSEEMLSVVLIVKVAS